MQKRRDPVEFFETFGAVRRVISALAVPVYAEEELGSTQAKFLRMIGQREGISQAELARATTTDPALTGRALATLVERGWVRRERSKTDRRGYVLALSASGKKKRDRVVQLRREISERVVAELDESDLQAFDRMAKKLLAAFG